MKAAKRSRTAGFLNTVEGLLPKHHKMASHQVKPIKNPGARKGLKIGAYKKK
jgi:hypothetical protein